jgi:hypothetical protein
MSNWYSVIGALSDLLPEAGRQLDDIGYVVLPGPATQGGWARLAEAYDRAVSAADPADVSIRSSTRIHDFVNRSPEFDGLYIYRRLLPDYRAPVQAQLDARQNPATRHAGPASPRRRQTKRRRVAVGRLHRDG